MVGLPSVWLLEGPRPLQLALSPMIDEDSRDRQIYLRGVREALDLNDDFSFELWFVHPGHIEVVLPVTKTDVFSGV
jgi:hypothetical protein